MTTFPYYPNVESALEKDIAKAEPQFMHNWLYSVVPVSERIAEYKTKTIPVNSAYEVVREVHNQEISYPLGAYLTGYCRNCRRAFSQPIPCDAGKYVETQMDIPVFGCVAPNGI